jgi:hypothetical protein
LLEHTTTLGLLSRLHLDNRRVRELQSRHALSEVHQYRQLFGAGGEPEPRI